MLGKKVILATIIVAVALMMLFSAVAPALAMPTPDRGPPQVVCDFLLQKLIEAGLSGDKIEFILAKAGCPPP